MSALSARSEEEHLAVYAQLKQRAEDQRRRVETQRLAAARDALAIASIAE
jgi:hypothetical protein